MLGDKDVCACLAVKDLDQARAFYEGVLGLQHTEGTEGGVFYKSGNSGVFVYPSEFAGTNQATAAAWNVADVEGAVEALRDKGVTFEHYEFPGVEVVNDVHIMGEIKSAWFKDPDGNILNIVNQMS